MSTYIKHNGEWKRVSGADIGQGRAKIVLSPDAWNDEYKPDVTTSYITTSGLNGATPLTYTLRGAASSPGSAYVNFTWSDTLKWKKARVYYYCITPLDSGAIMYHYDGNKIDLARGSRVAKCGYFDVDDITKLTGFELYTAYSGAAGEQIQLYAIELFN